MCCSRNLERLICICSCWALFFFVEPIEHIFHSKWFWELICVTWLFFYFLQLSLASTWLKRLFILFTAYLFHQFFCAVSPQERMSWCRCFFPLSLCFLPWILFLLFHFMPCWYHPHVTWWQCFQYSAIHLLRFRRLRYFSNIYSSVALSLEPHRWESLSIYHSKYKLLLTRHDSHSILNFIEPWYNVCKERSDGYTTAAICQGLERPRTFSLGITNQLRNILYNVHSKTLCNFREE